MKINKQIHNIKKRVMARKSKKKHVRKFITINKGGTYIIQKFPTRPWKFDFPYLQITRPTALAFSVDTDHIYTATEYLGDGCVDGGE